MNQGLEARIASLSFDDMVNEKGSTTQFEDLPEEARKNVLSRLTVVDIMRCRVVCTNWKAMLSPSSSSSSARPRESSEDFFRNFWAENRPPERWLFLHNGLVSKKNLVHDVEHQLCHSWRPNSDIKHLRPRLTIFNTTTNGLLFLVQHIRSFSDSVLHMWTCNPLTGWQTQLPDIPCDVIAAIVANGDASTTTSSRLESHYKLLLLESEKPSLTATAAEENRQVKVHLYSSKEKKWQPHKSMILVHRLCILYEVKRFYEYDVVYLLETPHSLRRSMDNTNVTGFCRLRWFNFEGESWDSCPVSPPEDLESMDYNLKYFFVLERNRELVLLAALANEDTLEVQFRVYNSSSTITAGIRCSWTLLSCMPTDFTSGRHGRASIPTPRPPIAGTSGGSSSSNSRRRGSVPQFRLESKIYAEVFPSPDKFGGDKLIIVLMGIESYEAVVSFNLESPPESAWKILMGTSAADDVRNEKAPSSRRTSLEEKFVRWSKSAVINFRGRTVLPYHESIFQSGSLQGFAFDHRFDDIEVDQPGLITDT